MVEQSRKYAMGLAGEFLVAGELLRRGIMAAVTLGNAKKADIIAVSGTHAVTLEVKTTSSSKWVLGGKVPDASANIWVFVHLPQEESLSPRYLVLTNEELRAIVVPADAAYRARYLERHGRTFSGKGVSSIERRAISETHVDAWHKVSRALRR